ncbi:hypothetical protein U14_05948 [Candidatus Moduliflexus flocculans]|uniref:Outer membrane protein beta-barrel domain-containing protein n=1 Tax=Candidatus Moduliflexus flocculans TaxID=1499966 RepID=A0A081BTD0_9BACT|nr:hypothetical protein U14_05948 [Candidatus Moduliflexus flocculans]
MKSIVVGIMAVVVMMGLTVNANAQTLYREITGFGGMTFDFGNDYGDDATAGIALAFNVSPRIGIEAEGGAIFADDTTFNGSLNLVLNFGSGASAIVPYIVGGGGVITDGGTDIAINGGLGLKMFIDYNIALRADFRAFFVTEEDDARDMERVYGGITFFF